MLTCTRGLLLTGLTAMTGVLLLRDRSEQQECDYDFICQDCKKLKDCNHRAARKYREQQSGSKKMK